MSKLFRFAVIIVSLVLSSCTTIAAHFPFVYAIDVDQGNIIDQEMIDQLRPEMNKRQVLFILGSPMLIDVFHKERWDYVYSIQPGSDERMQKRISLFFTADTLAGVQGDFRPSSVPVVLTSKEETVDVPIIERKKTLWEIISGWFTSDDTDMPEEITATDEVSSVSESSAVTITDQNIDEYDSVGNVTGVEEISTEISEQGSLPEADDGDNVETTPVLEIPDATGTNSLDEDSAKKLLEKDDHLIIPEQD